MGNAMLISNAVIYTVIAFFFILLGLLYWIYKRNADNMNTDKIILVDKNNRYTMINDNLFNKKKVDINKKSYYLKQGCGLVNTKGKALYIFPEDKPQPLNITYDKAEWISAESLRGMINNDLIGLMVRLKGAENDRMMIYGAIGGMVAGAASLLILGIQAGLINVAG